MMFELFGLTYALSKEVEDDSNWEEEEERVVSNWPENSGLKERAERQGITLKWLFPEKLGSYLNAGHEIVYEMDTSRRVRKKFVLKDGSILIGKRTG